MSAPKIKICGLSRAADIAAVNRYRPDYVGFILGYPPSRRSISLEQAAVLIAALDKTITPVGVFVDAPLADMLAAVTRRGVRVIQLHGHETDDTVRALKAATDVPIWQAFRVREAADIARAMCSAADMVLLDGASPGSGNAFDHSLLRQVQRPFILAGGLTPANVTEALQRCRPWGVDMSSGVETDRVKDAEKIAAAIAAVRTINT